MDYLTSLVLKQKTTNRKRLPIKGWEVWSKKTDGSPYQIVDTNNSLPILKDKYGLNYIYKSIR